MVMVIKQKGVAMSTINTCIYFLFFTQLHQGRCQLAQPCTQFDIHPCIPCLLMTKCVLSIAVSVCPDGWAEMCSSCLKLVWNNTNYDDARNDCGTQSGHLVFIRSETEKDCIVNYLE